MKTSQLAVVSVLGVLAVGVIAFMSIARIAVARYEASGGAVDRQQSIGAETAGNLALRDFRHIVVTGNWQVELSQGQDWQVEVTCPENLRDRLHVRVEGDRLLLGLRIGMWESWGFRDAAPRARIVMPALDAVSISGAGDVEFAGFTGTALDIRISGAADIDGADGRFDQLYLHVSGAGNVDLGDVTFTDAEVNLSGAGDVTLAMNGGVLGGQISGVGNVTYYGAVSDERIHISGFGKVRQGVNTR